MWLAKLFSVESVLDVGCGVGFATEFFHGLGCTVTGLDCEKMRRHHLMPRRLVAVDLAEGPLGGYESDLVWCCEVAEHLYEHESAGLVKTLAGNTKKVLAFSAAPEGAGGHHHVNTRSPLYWVRRLEDAGLFYRLDLTVRARLLCTAANGRTKENYFRRSGIILTR